MKKLPLYLLCFQIFFFSINVYAYQFKHFKILPKFKKGLNLHLKTNSFQDTPRNNSNSIYSEIADYIIPNYQTIGNSQVHSILNFNESYDMGSQNHSGFNWQYPMIGFKIGVDRKIEPEFNSERWIVRDKFILIIDAHTYLQYLNENKSIKINKTSLAAFAGIQFRREFQYVHFSETYSEGLSKEFNKLFLSFNLFREKNYLRISPYEIISKKDFIITRAGIGGSVPIGGPTQIEAGILVKNNLLSQVTVQAVGPLDNPGKNEFLRINYQQENIKEIEADLSLTLDFLEILRFPLLTYEYSESFSDSKKYYLRFLKDDLTDLNQTTPLSNAINQMFNNNKAQSDILSKYVVSEEKRLKEDKKSVYQIFLKGDLRNYHTEQVKIQNDKITKTFFRNRSENIKYVKSFLNQIIEAVSQSILDIQLFATYRVARIRNFMMEYEWNHKPATLENTNIVEEKHLSLSFKNEYFVKKTTGFSNKKYKRFAMEFIKNYTNLEDKYIEKIETNDFKGPLRIKVTTRINDSGLSYFNNLSIYDIEQLISTICGYKIEKINYLKNNQDPTSVLKTINSNFKIRKIKNTRSYSCFNKIKKKYLIYKESLQLNNKMNLWNLKDFLISFMKQSNNKNDMVKLFGEKNLFHNGSFNSQTTKNMRFISYFKFGNFTNLGVIDKFKNYSNIKRAPASIIVD